MERQLRPPMLGLGFLLWLCAAPFVILLLRPFLGRDSLVVVALGLLALFIGGCLILCRSGRPHGC